MWLLRVRFRGAVSRRRARGGVSLKVGLWDRWCPGQLLWEGKEVSGVNKPKPKVVNLSQAVSLILLLQMQEISISKRKQL